MTNTTPLEDSAIASAAALLRADADRRLAALRPLIQTRTDLAEARAMLAEAEARDARALGAALSAGWTADALAEVGLPGIKAPVRRRRPSRPRPSSKTPPPSE